ncbi:MAG: hypothetical protein HYX53_02585 [Chloroflexi bacterium]|nr:hypothetical protein [Chloroflexota bacterium]
MVTIYKVWIQIERCDEDDDEEPVNIALPDCIQQFDYEADARRFVEALLIATGSPALWDSEQLPGASTSDGANT